MPDLKRGRITVFAPTDEAFTKLPEGDLNAGRFERLAEFLSTGICQCGVTHSRI
jgi:hypothetical protein